MRCLLDKVTARHAVRGLLKSSLNLLPEPDEILALKVLTLRPQSGIEHFIAIPTANVLGQFVQNPRYQAVIHLFLDQVQIATPGRYYKRNSGNRRRCRSIKICIGKLLIK